MSTARTWGTNTSWRFEICCLRVCPWITRWWFQPIWKVFKTTNLITMWFVFIICGKNHGRVWGKQLRFGPTACSPWVSRWGSMGRLVLTRVVLQCHLAYIHSSGFLREIYPVHSHQFESRFLSHLLRKNLPPRDPRNLVEPSWTWLPNGCLHSPQTKQHGDNTLAMYVLRILQDLSLRCFQACAECGLSLLWLCAESPPYHLQDWLHLVTWLWLINVDKCW